MKQIILLVFTFLSFQLSSQTLIMNEVSNGVSGSGGGTQEYVEFVVASNTVTYSCTNSTPPCIDIRGWIFDDNSGYHGSAGIAAGAIRFSQSPVWACVPLGTIILIYNDADRNPAIPPDDITMADGNCTIIAPISNTTLFERNSTTPGAAACSYPATGWIAGGNWSNTAMANTSDCARVVNLAGCEVFSVCYGSANSSNNIIYFPGAGTGTVYFFNGTNPQLQTNWSSGSAAANQTPGAPNNAANAAYIGRFNNNCTPITPIAINTPTTVNAGCTCNGSASVNASGSIGPYTYVWYDAAFNPIGQNASTATGLCAGVYKVIATSHIGCSDTTTVTIGSTGSAVTLAVNSETICSGNSTILTATTSSTGGTYSWTPGGQTTQSISVNPSVQTTYSVTYSVVGCSATAVSTVAINSSPTASITSSTPSLCASGQTATLTLSGSTGTYSWSNGATTSTTSISSPGVYSATVTTTGCGVAISSFSIGTLPQPTIAISTPTTDVCAGSTITLTANSNTGNYLWSTGVTTQTVSVNTSSISVTTSNSCGSSSATQILNIIPLPTVTVTPALVSLCTGQSATVQATTNTPVTYTWSTGVNTSSVILNSTGIYTVEVSNACGMNSATVDVSVSASPTLSISPSSSVLCASGQTATLSLSGSTGTYSWSNGSTASTSIVNSPGVYTATVTTAGCGTVSASITIAALSTPTVSISASGATQFCNGGSVILTANSSESNYSWSNGATTQTVSVNTSTTITVTSTNVCGSTPATQTINVLPQPDVTANPNFISLCAGQSTISTASSSLSTGITYSWSTGATTNTVSLNAAGVYTVIASNSCGNAPATVSVSLSSVPTITATTSASLICNSWQTATLTANGSTGNYLWSNGATTSVTSVSNSGVYTVTLTNSCGQDTSSVSVTISSMPTLTLSPNTMLCPGHIGTLTATSNNTSGFTWSTGATTHTILTPTPGSYWVAVSNACGTKTATATVGSITMSPIIITPSSYSICPNETATLTATGGLLSGFGPSTYAWSNSAATGSVNTTTGSVVTLSVTNMCGTYTESISISVNPINAAIVANPVSGTSPLVVSFADNSTHATTWLWDFGNGSVANTQTVSSQTYNSVGVYTTYLTVTNGVCMDMDSVIITVLEDGPTLYVPNAFTPNGDSINDFFRVGATGIKEFNMIIFDRWGLKMFETNDILKGWDGKVNGNSVADGTYYHLIRAKGIDDVEIKKQGTVTLFK